MTTSRDFADFDLSGSMRDIARGLLVKPVLHTYLYDAKFPEFTLTFAKQDMERAPDNYFHPSTHPLMHERALYQYLAHPDTFPVEKKQYMGTLSVTIGKVMHEFFQICLTDAGIRPPHLQVCKVCPPIRQCKEAGVVDLEVGERGHVDGMLSFVGFPNVPSEKMEPVWEFKTSADNFGRLSGMEDLDLEAFKKKWPVYYGQQQSYMRMSGKPFSIVLMMEVGYPWTMREFHIPYDMAYSTNVVNKYRRVRQAVADQRPPICCGQKGCPSAITCGVVR